MTEKQQIFISILNVASEQNLDNILVQAIVQTESSFNDKAYRFEPMFYVRYLKFNKDWKTHRLINEPKRISASYGLSQVMYTTAIEYGMSILDDPETLYDIEKNLTYGCKILYKKIQKYGLLHGILAYNAGSARPAVKPKLHANYNYLVKVATAYKRFGGKNTDILAHAKFV